MRALLIVAVACAPAEPPTPPPRPIRGAALERTTAAVHAPRVVGLQLGEKTTCLERPDGSFQCFGALRIHGATPGSALHVTDRQACTWDGRLERCHADDGRLHVRPTPFVEVRTGGAGCGRDPDGAVWCWSRRMSQRDRSATPVVPIPIDGAAIALTATGTDACVLTSAHEVHCFDPVRHVFGFGRPATLAARSARLLAGTYLQRCWAEHDEVRCQRMGRTWRVPGVGHIRLLAVGLDHGCAVDERLTCWGSDRYGQRRAPPIDGELVVDLSAGDHHTCALLFGGAVRCWGRDDQTQVSGPCAAGLCD